MKNYNIVHLFDDYCRFTLIITEGLLFHPEINEVYFNKSIKILNKVIANGTEWKKLQEILKRCDYFFFPDKDHFKITHIINFLDKEKLWYKAIIYDFKDTQYIEYDLLDVCAIYFKRSVCFKDRSLIKTYRKGWKIFPLNYSSINEYFLQNIDFKNRNIDVGAYFSFSSIRFSLNRRKKLLKSLFKSNFKGYNVEIGKPTIDKEHGRYAIFDDEEDNAWYEYIKKLNQCKIIFSAYPDHFDGDSRIWESMSSGALCFIDKGYIPTEKKLRNNIHAIFYNALSKKSILQAINKRAHVNLVDVFLF